MPEDDLVVLATEALDVREGRSAGQRLAGLPSSRRPGRLLRQRPARPRPAPAGDRLRRPGPRAARHRGLRRHRLRGRGRRTLTSVRQPRQELGRTAAELVLDEATNAAHQHRQVLFTPELVARASTLG